MSVLGRYFLKLKNLFYVLKKQVLFSPSPEQTALSILFGFYLGVFPIVGTMTILCLTAAFTFRLNYFITLAINYLVAPPATCIDCSIRPNWKLAYRSF